MADPKYSRYYTYIEPIAENKTVRSYAPYVFSLISIAVFGVFAIRPTITTISNLQKEVSEKQQLLDQLQQKANSLDTAKKNLDAIPADKKTQIANALPNNPQVTDFIANLQSDLPKEASSPAIQVQPVLLYDSTPSNGAYSVKKMSFIFNLKGSFSDLSNVSQAIKTLPRLTAIDEITLNKSEDGTLTLSVTADALYLK